MYYQSLKSPSIKIVPDSMLIFSDLFFLRLFRILGNWEIPGNGAHFSSGKKVPKLNRAMGHPSFFRGVKLKAE